MEISFERHITLEQYQLLEKENIELKKKIEEQNLKIITLEHELSNLKRAIYGSKSERFVPQNETQLSLNMGIEEVKPEPPQTETITITRTKKQSKKKAIRLPIPAHLPRKEIIIEPEFIPEGAKKIGELITEKLECIPTKLFVTKYIRPKYVVPQQDEEKSPIIVAEPPAQTLPKAIAAASLLSYIIISKYVDHLPFYRIVQMFKREDVNIPESTINGWFSETCNLLEPLYNALVKHLLESDYLMADESPIPVQTSEKKGATHKGYFWVYHNPINRFVCFDYRSSRGGEGPKKFLENFTGTLQTDGYAAYDFFDNKPDIALLACMAHARRKFEQSLDNNKELATYALIEIGKLYQIERLAVENNLTFDQIKELRQKEAVPILENFENWLNEQSPKQLPQSAIGKAIAYTLNLWHRLKRYVEDGKYKIDNNLIENSIRPMTIGRKNYLFAGSHDGAKRAAMMYSLLGTCKMHDVNPLKWLTHILNIIPEYKVNKLHELFPQNFKELLSQN